MMKKIIFSHGRQGKPDGRKIRQLTQIVKAKGWQSHSVDYTDTLDPDIRAQRLIDVVSRQQQPFCLVGSSMGGYASLIAADSADKHLLKGVFLMAPALFLPRYRQQRFTTAINTLEIVHGWHDTTVLYEHSIRYARQANCILHLLNDNHHFSENPEAVEHLFTLFLQRIDLSI